jgi:hypothetical protein
MLYLAYLTFSQEQNSNWFMVMNDEWKQGCGIFEVYILAFVKSDWGNP